MEMPELEMEEARSLFLDHVACVPSVHMSNKDDYELILSCTERCHFKKGDGTSSHYHPFALQTLGEQLRSVGYVPERWRSVLCELDFLNPNGERQHPLFSILRRSFDALNPQDQFLFMDVALFAPYIGGSISFKWNVYEWLAMVHGMPVESVIERLENLKRKSLLEFLGDGFGRIGMHDLWRDFARLEPVVGEFERRRWIFERDAYNALEGGSVTNGDLWVNVRRMFFLDKGFVKLEDVNFDCFPNVTVLKLSTVFGSVEELDLRGLKRLKSLEVDFSPKKSLRPQTPIPFVGLGSLSKLGFLRWLKIPSDSPCIDEIVRLTNLQVLELHGCRRVPDLSRLISLQVACFRKSVSAVTILGLSSRHTNLQFLDLSWCNFLMSCPGVGELVALQELCLTGCSMLFEIPNLQKLRRLRKLDVRLCSSLIGLPGLGDLVSLLELHAGYCELLAELPDLRNLQNLRVLDLSYCECIKSLLGLHVLVGLQFLKTSDCKNFTQLPDMKELTNLQTLALDPYCPLQASTGWSDLISLRSLHVGIDELHGGPDLCKLTKLETLHISGWQGRGFSSLAELVSLVSATVANCKGVRVFPNLKRLSKLRHLNFCCCEFEDLSGLINLTSLEELEITDCDKFNALPDLRKLARLKKLRVKRCARLRDVRGILGLQNLEEMQVSGHPNLGLDLQGLTGLRVLDVSDCGFEDLQGLATCLQLRTLICSGCPIQELPDLANFPELFSLDVRDCVHLTKLTCAGPVSPKFSELRVGGCMRLQALPDLTNALDLRVLDVSNSGVLSLLSI